MIFLLLGGVWLKMNRNINSANFLEICSNIKNDYVTLLEYKKESERIKACLEQERSILKVHEERHLKEIQTLRDLVKKQQEVISNCNYLREAKEELNKELIATNEKLSTIEKTNQEKMDTLEVNYRNQMTVLQAQYEKRETNLKNSYEANRALDELRINELLEQNTLLNCTIETMKIETEKDIEKYRLLNRETESSLNFYKKRAQDLEIRVTKLTEHIEQLKHSKLAESIKSEISDTSDNESLVRFKPSVRKTQPSTSTARNKRESAIVTREKSASAASANNKKSTSKALAEEKPSAAKPLNRIIGGVVEACSENNDELLRTMLNARSRKRKLFCPNNIDEEQFN